MRPGDAAAMATAAALAAVLCVAAIAYGRRRGLLDQPGPRRSHAVPTPRVCWPTKRMATASAIQST